MTSPSPTPASRRAPNRRNPWEVQRSVLFALLLREMKSRVGGQWIGAVWTLFEPTAHVLMMLSLVMAMRGDTLLGGTEYPMFLATGLVPFFLFQNLATRLMDGIAANRGLFSYRQVLPLDTLVCRAFVEALMNLLVYVFTLALLGVTGNQVSPSNPLEVLGVHTLLFFFGLGFGILTSVVSHERPRLRSFIRMAMIPLYLASGVVYPIHYAPRVMVDGLLFNPLLHLIELSRQAFISNYTVLDGVNVTYPMLFALALLALAMLVYRADRLRLVTSV